MNWVLIASGPSVTAEQIEAVRLWHADGQGKVAVVNTTWESAPWADALYGCPTWWRHNHELASRFRGEKWTTGAGEAHSYGLQHVDSQDKVGLSKDTHVVYRGGGKAGPGNSGYQLINLVRHWGAKKIILLGYDMKMDGKRKNHHRPHTQVISSPYHAWIPQFSPLAVDLYQEGIEVLNATPGSAIKAFKTIELSEALRACSVLAA